MGSRQKTGTLTVIDRNGKLLEPQSLDLSAEFNCKP